MAKHSDTYQTITVKPNKEFRIIIDQSLGEEISIEILEGNAEIFGVEMLYKKLYTFSSSLAVLTRHGCTLKMDGYPSNSYSVMKTVNPVDDIHAYLEDHRIRAERKDTKGPITLIAGPMDAGKSTLTRTLLNYAVRSRRKPLYFDLDVGQSSISIPGTMSVLPIEEQEDLNMGFNDSSLSAYYFGYVSPGMNIALYFLLMQRLGLTLRQRMMKSNAINCSGAIIDTCGWVEGAGYQSILAAARSFEISHLIVLSDKRLHSSLKMDLSPNIEIKFIPKLDGVIQRNKNVRRERRDYLIHEYFYGNPHSKFNPYTIRLKFSEIQIVQVSTPKTRVSVANMNEVRDLVSIVLVPFSPQLHNKVLAISYADDFRNAMLESVLGFVCVLNIDMEGQILTFLSPQPHLMQKRILIMGDLTFYRN